MDLKFDPRPFRFTPSAVDASGRYQPVSYWQETIAVAPGEPLVGATEADVAILGGGYSGLSTAIELKRLAPNLDVVLLERSVVGHGASGRNGGFVMPLIGWDMLDAAKKLGELGCQAAYRLMGTAVERLKQRIHAEAIDCDLEETGYLLLATCRRRAAHVEREVALAKRLGFDYDLLSGASLKDHIDSDAFLCGGYDPHPAIVNPAKLARGLKKVAEKMGVRIFEQTPVLEFHDGERGVVRTERGSVQCRATVLALNGYGAAMGFMPSRILPVHTFIVLTEPLSDSQLDSIGWRKRRTSLETARNFIHYFRLTADDRIAFGGEDAWLYYAGRYADGMPSCFDRLEARFREYFPSLRSVRFTHRWGGVLGVTLDMFPTFGRGGRSGTVFHAAGYSGHGVALSNFAGELLTPHILASLGEGEAPTETPFFHNRAPWPIPPEPLRYGGMHLYRLALKAQDAWERA